MVASTTGGYGAMETFDNAFIYTSPGMGNVYESYSSFTGGGKKKAKKTKKSKTRTPLRKPISKKTKRMARMRVKSIKNIEKRKKKLSKRLKKRKSQGKVLDSLITSSKLSKKQMKLLSPEMKKFVSKIPSSPAISSRLKPWPSLSDISLHSLKPPSAYKAKSKAKSKSTRKKNFEDARIGLAEILKKKPIYASKSKSVIKFSDYKKPMTKEKAALLFKSKKKGKTR